MKKHVWAFLAAAVLLLYAPLALGQECGDVDGTGDITISDVAQIADHIAISGAPLANDKGDCDGRIGVTAADAQTVARYLFEMIDQRDCDPQLPYSFDPAMADTVFLPYMNAIPEDVDSVFLPVMTSCSPGTEAYYISALVTQTGGGETFSFNRVDVGEYINGVGGAVLWPDTASMLGVTSYPTGAIVGRHQCHILVFRRNDPGVVSIATEPVERTPIWKTSVERSQDLFLPVVVYYEVPVPGTGVTVAPTELGFTASAGSMSHATEVIDFTSDFRTVTFDLEASDDWISFVDPTVVTGLTTPATVEVRLDATALAVGEYAGEITITSVDPADAEFDTYTIAVSATVNAPDLYPPGDLNCDGIVSISDISLLIDHLFINQQPLPICE